MKLKLIVVLSLNLAYSLTYCGNFQLQHQKYRAVLHTPGGDLPFALELNVDDKGKGVYTVINASEQISNDFIFSEHDSFNLVFPVFDTYIRAVFKDNNYKSLTGIWYDRSRTGNYFLKFDAYADENFRFVKDPLTSLFNISGRWATTFSDESSKDETVGILEQKNNHLSGTFLTTTGDYRFLEGEVSADSFFLSAFDGSHAFLFKGKLNTDGTLSGKWWSGKHYTADFNAVRNENAQLPDPKTLTYLKEGYAKLEFAFPNENGDTVALSDEKFREKVIIVFITGSWCPNCMDETSYLSELEEKYKNKDLEIIALSFERKPDPENFKRNIEKERNYFGLDYTILNAGLPKDANKMLPMLNNIMSFPTTVILNKKHEVVEIYTGFSGPATGDVFVKYQKDFEGLLNDLLSQ